VNVPRRISVLPTHPSSVWFIALSRVIAEAEAPKHSPLCELPMTTCSLTGKFSLTFDIRRSQATSREPINWYFRQSCIYVGQEPGDFLHAIAKDTQL
jgi:hypothetical protein